MSALSIRWALALGALMAALAGIQTIRTLHVRLAAAQDATRQARQQAGARETLIDRLLADTRHKEEQRAQLDRTRDAIDATLASYQSALRRLIDENDAVRAWAGARLPDNVVRLHSSPALAGANDYIQHMCGGDALHDASDVAADQR